MRSMEGEALRNAVGPPPGSEPRRSQSSSSSPPDSEGNQTATGSKPRTRPRFHKWAPKVKTGCLTCRARKVKCDETKPMCRRCSTTGRICEGAAYISVHPWAAASRRTSTTAPKSSPHPAASVPRMAYSPTPLHNLASEQERAIFFNFHTETVVRLSGVFNRDFWVSGLPSAAQTHPAIWHAGLAIGAMQIYRDSVQGVAAIDPQSDMYEFALTHFNRAISTIVPMMQPGSLAPKAVGDIDVVLLASVLFIAINNLLGDKEKSAQHAKSALALFQQWDFAELARQRGRDPTVINARALSIVYGQLAMHHGVDISLGTPPDAPESMSGLSSVNEAWAALQDFTQPFVRYQKSRVPAIAASEPRAGLADSFDEMQRFDALFYEWRWRFDRFRSSGIPSADDVPSIRALRLHSYTLSTRVSYPLLTHSASWRTSPREPDVDDTKTVMVLMRDHVATEMALTKGKGYIFMHNVSLADIMFQYGFIYKDPVLRNVFKIAMSKWPSDGVIFMAGCIAAVDTALADKEMHGHVMDPIQGGCICQPPETICHHHEVIRLDILMNGDRAATLTVASILEHQAGRRGSTTEAAW